MKRYQFIKIVLLIFVFSTNLMLGQKMEAPSTIESIKRHQCPATDTDNKNKVMEPRILQLQPNFVRQISVGCFTGEISQSDSIEVGAFFSFTAF